ncbi:hypothetical protein [Sphaerisporangium rufum]|uniref:hypothetical protein n=1 Tax=Sphaerisporangium rufum TaxID=1381558 RepID=UPI001950F242|nr:hypothetical protein [Sphaerisporangium rufum]
MRVWAAVAGLVVLAGVVFALARYSAAPPPAGPGAVRLTLSRPGLPPLQHPYPGGAVSLNAMLGGGDVLIGMRGTAGGGREVRVSEGQTVEVPGGRLRLVGVWDMWRRDRDAVDVVLSTP